MNARERRLRERERELFERGLSPQHFAEAVALRDLQRATKADPWYKFTHLLTEDEYDRYFDVHYGEFWDERWLTFRAKLEEELLLLPQHARDAKIFDSLTQYLRKNHSGVAKFRVQTLVTLLASERKINASS